MMAINVQELKNSLERRVAVDSIVIRTIYKDKLALVGVVTLTILSLLAIFAPQITGSPTEQSLTEAFIAPSLEHPLGTDRFGRDILTRVIHGARISLVVAFAGVGIATTAGTIGGLIAGYYQGKIGSVIMRITDIMFSFPVIIFALTLIVILQQSILNVIIAIGIVYTPTFARLARGSTLSVKEEEFIQSAQAVGESDVRIMFSEILPNIGAPIIVQSTISLALAVLLESSLSFLGLGVPPPNPSWGLMLAGGRGFTQTAPWWVLSAGGAIMITVLSFNFLGDALRDSLDPKQKEQIQEL